jgi:hypothetical protein
MTGFNINEAERFLQLLGKNGASRLRAFWPRNRPVPEGTPRARRQFLAAPDVRDRRQLNPEMLPARKAGPHRTPPDHGDSATAILRQSDWPN